jgi:hypothetical protein
MVLSTRTQKYVWGLFAGRCAICKETLIEDDGDTRTLVGELAHIAGDRPGAARFDPMISDGDRNDPDNLILLCRRHHKIVDDNEDQFTTQKLLEIRQIYLVWLSSQLAAVTPWMLKVSSFIYLNVPRLSEYATMQGYQIRLPDLPNDVMLHDLGFALNRVMADFRRPLESMAIGSVNAGQISFPHEGYIGQLLSFERLRFRTKNLPTEIPKGKVSLAFTGDSSVDSHIYHKFDKWTLVFNIDPRWITTTTAFTLFRPSGGSSLLTGFGRIHSVDFTNSRMTATALAVGTPQSKFDLMFKAASSSEDRITSGREIKSIDFESLEDDVTKSRGSNWHGNITHCDFCGQPFAREEYMIDGPINIGGPWGNMCVHCYSVSRLALGIGKGQLYRWNQNKWSLVGGYPEPVEPDPD